MKIKVKGTEKIGWNVSLEKPTVVKLSIINICTRYAPKLYLEREIIILLSLSVPFALYLNHMNIATDSKNTFRLNEL